MPEVDVVILSNAATHSLHKMTLLTISSLLLSEELKPFNIIIMEQNPAISYEEATTIHYSYPFNFNKVANHGIMEGMHEWIVLANNDLIFHPHWWTNLRKHDNPVLSPHSILDKRQNAKSIVLKGYQIGRHFSGWCFAIKRETYMLIGGFNEDYLFYASDNALCDQLREHGIVPWLIRDSLVTHLESQTLTTLSSSLKSLLLLSRYKNITLTKLFNIYRGL